jgi:hypothetical protein
VIPVDRHAGRGGHALGPAQILHRDRHAVQRSAIATAGDLRLRRLGLRHRGLRHHQHIAAELAVERGDAIELRARHRDRRDLARPDARRQLHELEVVQVVGGDGVHASISLSISPVVFRFCIRGTKSDPGRASMKDRGRACLS